MNILSKFKETVISVLPVMLIVLILGLTIVPLDNLLLGRFLIAGFILIIGLTIFLLGVDLGIQPMGERCGAELTKKRNLPLLLFVALIIGFIVTVAEPDIQVFADQVKNIFSYVNKTAITFIIAAGVGLFITLGLLRSVLNFSLKLTLFICYVLLFAVVFITPDIFIPIAFDSGGATTGPMTVPFIMALGLGVVSVRSGSNKSSSFGLTGIISIGPVFAVLFYAIFLKANGLTAVNQAAQTVSETAAAASTAVIQTDASILYGLFSPFGKIFASTVKESLISILPLLVLFFIFQLILLKMTRFQVLRIIIGFIYSFTGLTIFLIGVNGGFSQAGAALGQELGKLALTKGGIWYFVLILTGLVFGAIIVCAEPAVWVLSQQVEQVSGGTIKRKVLLAFLSVGTAAAIALSLVRAIAGFDLKYILIPCYALALILMYFCPENFSGIAFDSGGVASGPLTSTFILSFTIGAASSRNGSADSFGVIALVAAMPLIAIQLMGIIFNKKRKLNKKTKEAAANV